jgi:4-amino-4-deoxy-L-arabinose transferase-like glycosyltransferase
VSETEPAPAPRLDARTARWLALLTLAAVVLRLAWLFELALLPWFEQHTTDSYLYDRAARRIAGGDLLLGHEPMVMSPGYFYFLGGVYACFGAGPWAIRIVQVVLGAATVPMTFFVARRIVAPPAALFAAGLVAFAGPMIFFDGLLLPESPAALALTSLALTVLRARETKTLRDASLAGALGGLGAVLRPNVLFVLPIVWGLVASAGVSGRAKAAALACAVGASVLLVAPVTARNYVASHELVVLTTHGGLNLFVGNGPGATGTFRVPAEVPGADSPFAQFAAFDREAERAVGHPVDAAEADAYWRDRVVDQVAAHPLDAVVLLARKTHLFFNARDLGLVLSHEFARRVSAVLGGPLVQFGLVAPLALVGLLLAAFARRGRPEWTLAMLTLGLVTSVIVVFVTDRYRTPMMPLLVVMAVWLLTKLRALAQERARRALVLLGLALALAGVAAWPAAGDRHFDRDYAALAVGYEELGAPFAADESIAEALRIAPRSLPALEARANVLDMRGDPDAVEAWISLRDEANAAGDRACAARAQDRVVRHGAR